MTDTGTNAAQVEYWNTVAGPKWVELQGMLDDQIRPYGEAVMQAASIQSSETLLDVGCGCGDTTLALAARIGSGGKAVGVDISGPMLTRAREIAASRGVTNVAFLEADAQVHAFEPTFDVVFSRFGVMFFDDPVAAFTNLRSALRPGGRIAFVCWQRIAENPWMLLPTMAALQHIKIDLPADPNAPGPFSLGDADRVKTTLEAAGFVDIRIDALCRDVSVGGATGLDGAVSFMLRLCPASAALAETSADVQRAVRDAVYAAMEPYTVSDEVRMPSATWVVTARRGVGS